MNEIEKRINMLLSKNNDIAAGILQILGDLSTSEELALPPQMQNELMYRLMSDRLEESVWDNLLLQMPPDMLSEELLDYLFRNKISLLTLCHLQLKDEWLLKLLPYDDAPLYTLAKRYYLSETCSAGAFLQFYNQYLRDKNEISLQLLEIYRKAAKREVLLSACLGDKTFRDKKKLQWHQTADRVRGLTERDAITAVYREYPDVGIVLAEIAGNPCTPEEILLELSCVKGIQYAGEIRKISKNTLNLKKIADLQT